MPAKRRSGRSTGKAKAEPKAKGARGTAKGARRPAKTAKVAPRVSTRPKLTPFLWFDDDLEEALAFYKATFPDVKVWGISRYPEGAPGPAGKVMSASFSIAGQEFGAINGGPAFRFTEAISFLIDCKDQAEVDSYWERLTADGGEESQCGWCKDRFGLSWQVIPRQLTAALGHRDPAKAQRAMQAMMPMRKIDVAAIEAAVKG